MTNSIPLTCFVAKVGNHRSSPPMISSPVIRLLSQHSPKTRGEKNTNPGNSPAPCIYPCFAGASLPQRRRSILPRSAKMITYQEARSISPPLFSLFHFPIRFHHGLGSYANCHPPNRSWNNASLAFCQYTKSDLGSALLGSNMVSELELSLKHLQIFPVSRGNCGKTATISPIQNYRNIVISSSFPEALADPEVSVGRGSH